MGFYAIEIEECPGFGFSGGPEFQTDIQNIVNGHESRNADWAICRHKYTAPFTNISDEQYANIKKVFLIARGRCHSFLLKDWGDFKASNEQFAVGDGVTKVFQLKKVSTLAGTSATYERTISRPLAGVQIFVAGVLAGAVVSLTSGTVTFAVAPAIGAPLTWSGEFRVQVRFDIDYLPFSLDQIREGGFARNGSIDLIEVIGEDDDAT